MLFGLLSPGLAPSGASARLAPRASSALRSRAGASRAKAVASWLAEVDEKGVEYVGSYGTPREMPFLPLPEICLAGRSNVGKSSCLNALSGRRKKVAVASKQPGRTRLLNLFRVGRACAITDLPGYGFAKVSRDMQDSWKKNIEGYMKRREQLRLSVLLVDAQREPSELDASLLDFLAYYEVPTLVVATKTDKLKPAQLDASLAALADALELPEGQPLPFSAVTKDGRKELWNAIQAQAAVEKLR
jgi:GTP-binding protein